MAGGEDDPEESVCGDSLSWRDRYRIGAFSGKDHGQVENGKHLARGRREIRRIFKGECMIATVASLARGATGREFVTPVRPDVETPIVVHAWVGETNFGITGVEIVSTVGLKFYRPGGGNQHQQDFATNLGGSLPNRPVVPSQRDA